MVKPWASQQKADKSTVCYERSASPNVRCGLCCYYTGADCDLVYGPISPNAVCGKFEPVITAGHGKTAR